MNNCRDLSSLSRHLGLETFSGARIKRPAPQEADGGFCLLQPLPGGQASRLNDGVANGHECDVRRALHTEFVFDGLTD